MHSDSIEHVNRAAFDSFIESMLTCPLEDLKTKEDDWKKFDRPCPPGNDYVYAVQRLGDVTNKRVLDFGCGTGYLSVILARRGGKVSALDISRNSLKVAWKRAVANNLQDRVHGQQMSASKLAYKDEVFDVIIGLGVLQYMDLRLVSPELARVLKKGSKAVFVEPYNNCHSMQLALNTLKKVWSCPFHGRPLTAEDLDILSKPFSCLSCKEFGLFSRVERIIRNRKIVRYVRMVDGLILERIPYLRKFARSVVIELVK